MSRTRGSLLLFAALVGWALALAEDESPFGQMRRALQRFVVIS